MKSSISNFIFSKYVRLFFAFVICGLSFYLAVRSVTLQELWQVILKADYLYIGLALLSVTVYFFVKTLRWKVLLGLQGRNIHLIKVFMALLSGHTLNLIYPGRIGDLGRIYIIGNSGVGSIFVLGTLLIEKVFDMVSYAILFIVLLLFIPLPSWVSNSGYTYIGVTFLLILVIFIITWKRIGIVKIGLNLINYLPDRVKKYIVGPLQTAFTSLKIIRNWRTIALLALLSSVIWGIALLHTYLILCAVRIQLPLIAALLVVIGLQAGISIATIPGRIGIFEYICVLTLSVFNVNQGVALSYGILLHVIALIIPAIVGLFFIWIFWISGIKFEGKIEEIDSVT